MRAVAGSVHWLASAANDRGEAEPDFAIDHALLLIRPSDEQQAELDRLLRDQRNPASADYQRWLTPEEYADRFGLTPGDQSKIVAWLTAEGLTVHEASRSRNWVAFSGSAGRISKVFRTSIHRYSVGGTNHFANATSLSVPAAVAHMVGGFGGLNDFVGRSNARVVAAPDFTSGANHFLAPADFSTIYNVGPLAAAGYDGTGQRIAVVGQSDIDPADIAAFRSRFGLPPSAPQLIPFGADPGFNGAQIESNLDIEWAGALAPKATIRYVYSTNAFSAILYAVSINAAPILTVSFGICETDAPTVYGSVVQQANAQGMTVLVAAGDAGGSGCDFQGDLPVATHGPGVSFPANLPGVTAMGGTMFNEGSGTYWGTKNASNGGSVLSYVPEVAWNESNATGLGAGGGGASVLYAKPDWQTGPGVPADGARDLPDLALSSAGHDAYLIVYQGALAAVAGTSTAAPSMAGILGLLNQYVVKQGIQKTAGLGNINPQLYRLAQSHAEAFHDITSGDNKSPCEQGSPGCLTGSLGYAAGPGYDLATGLGSIDANALFAAWGDAQSPVSVTLTPSASKVTLNDTFTLTATVAAATGTGVPTGQVSFALLQQTLGTAQLATVAGVQTATVNVPAWRLGSGTVSVTAVYAGDGAFSGGAASSKIQVTLPTTAGTAAIAVTVSDPVYSFQTGTPQPTWQAFVTLSELAGAPAQITGFTVDGAAQPLAQYFPSPNIPAKGSLSANIVFRNLAVPVIKTFAFTGVDLSGGAWSRQVQVAFRGPIVETQVNFNVWANPLTMQQNVSAPAACQWSQQIVIDEVTGYAQTLTAGLRGSTDITAQIASIFGTTRLAPWGSLQGALCWSSAEGPGTNIVLFASVDDFGDQILTQIDVTLTGPPAAATTLSASPASLSLKPSITALFPGIANLQIALSDNSQPWTATVFPANRTTAWLQLGRYGGTGSANISAQADGAGFEPGTYRATIVIQSPNATPQWVAIPVMFVNAIPSGPAAISVGNGVSFTPGVSPGTIAAVYGSQLANTTMSAAGLPLPISLAGVSATVNGWPAPLFYVSPTQINFQVPFEVGAGPAVLGINNNGQVGGFSFTIAPASPGIVTVNGATAPSATAKQGGYATVYVTGTGDTNVQVPSGQAVAKNTPVSFLPMPLLPVTVTVGGVSAFVQFAGATPGVVGLTQINFAVPNSVAAGVQPVVVTVGGVASAPANITVTAAQ